MNHQNVLRELESLLFENPTIRAALVEDICSNNTIGIDVFSPGFLESHPQLKNTLLDMFETLDRKIANLSNLLSQFPDTNFSLASLNVEEIRNRFIECRALAQDICQLLEPIQKAALVSADSSEKEKIFKLNLKLPKLVYEYPQWLSNCAVLWTNARKLLELETISPSTNIAKQLSVDNSLSIRMLRCLDLDDSLAYANDFGVFISDDDFIDVIVSEGEFEFPAEDLRNIGTMIGYNATDCPLVYFTPIDNYAQMIAYELFRDTREYPWALSNLGTTDDRFVVLDSSKAIAIPSQFLSAANIPEHGDIVCRLVCSNDYLEIWEPDVMLESLKDIDLSALFFD